MKKCSIYKNECKEWLKKDETEKTLDNLKTHFIEVYFKLKEENELKKPRWVRDGLNTKKRSSPCGGS